MLISEQNCLVVKPEETGQLFDLLSSRYREDTAIFCGTPPLMANLGFGRDKNIFIDTSVLDQVSEHVLSDMVIAVQTGITLAGLADLLAEHGQIFPVDVQDPDVRLIDVIASGDGGYLEQGFGYMRSLVLGLEVAYGGGKCAKLGGRVVKNVTGFDLTKLVVGGRGIFGVPYLAHLRLFAKPPMQRVFVVAKRSPADLMLVAAKLLLSGLPLSGLVLIESNAGAVDPASKYALIVHVMGSESLLLGLAKQIRQHAGEAVSELSREELVQAHPVLVHPPSTYLEVSLSKATAVALIDHLDSTGDRGVLRYRPGLGRLFFSTDEATLEKADQIVSNFLGSTQHKTGGNALAEFEQATISKSSGPYKFSSHCQRAGDASFGQLVDRLRRTFDPLKCFGTGVTFHGS